jgi:Delta-aminolevulinic acid dehydratase
MPYLDVIQLNKKKFKVPTFGLQVSGEFIMLKKMLLNLGWLG